MKYRYLIEVMTDYGTEGFTVSTLHPGDDDGRSSGFFETVDAAKSKIEQWVSQSGDADGAPVKWKDPPQEWQPDAVTITQYFDDGIEESRDT